MTPELLQAYRSAPVPWDQVSYSVDGADIESGSMTGPETAVFTVIERRDEGGEVFVEKVRWEMKKSGGAWLVNDAVDSYGESLLH